MSAVAFRKIGGRIVPIRLSEENKNKVKGGGLIAAGLGGAYVTGKVASRLMHSSANLENVARDAATARHNIKSAINNGPLFSHAAREAAKKVSKESLHAFNKSKILEKRSFGVRNIGTALSAGLIASGVNKVLKNTALEKHEETRAVVATGAGVGATFAVRSAYLRGFGLKGFGMLKQAARRAFYGT